MNIYWKANPLLSHGVKFMLMVLALLAVRPMVFAQTELPVASVNTTSGSISVNTMINVSAASYIASGEIAADSIVAGFGTELATEVAVAASLPLPTELAGIRISVKDSNGTTRFAPLFFVSPNQINYQIPLGTAEGAAAMTVTRNNNTVALGSARIIRVAPGLFAANANGQGVPTALALRVRADSSLSYEPVAQYQAEQSRFTHVPIDMGEATDQIFLVLYGTGIRFNSGVNSILATVGGLSGEVFYAGPAPGFAGVDQINLRLPRQLVGRGEVTLTLTASARESNTVSIIVR
jgi:uncharacterized protein (TIGR03437 family)